MRSSSCLCVSSLLALSALLTGCDLSGNAPSSVLPGAQLSGTVRGGQQPIVGAHVYVFAAGTSGYGGASTSLLTSGLSGTDSLGGYVTTDMNGTWAVTGQYTCTTGTQVYLLATQGNPGLGSGATNPNLALMAALGQCPASGSLDGTNPYVIINEVTTVASVYALSGFMSDYIHVGSSGTPLALTGIANAFANVSNLVDIATGTAYSTTPHGNGIVPQAEINTLADILAACVNSAGASSPGCTTLFSNALNGTTAPTDTTTAALNIAQNPGTRVSALFGPTAPTSPFAPTLSSAPNDFTLSLTFTDSSLNAPSALAIDGPGNVWIANSGSSTVTELNALGEPAAESPFSAGGITSPDGIAVDNSGNIWTSNSSNISEITSLGAAVGASPFVGTVSGSNVFQPRGIAIDGSGNAWVANFGGGESGGLYEFGSSGTQLSPTNGYGSGFGIDTSVAIDPSGDAWAVDLYFGGLDEYNPSGTVLSPQSGWDEGINSPEALAIDHSGNAWVADHGSNVAKVPNSGTPTASYTGGGLHYGQAVAIDGLDNVWIANITFSSSPGVVSEFSNAGAALSPSTGFASTSLLSTTGIAIDGSGDVWTCNSYTTTPTAYTVTEFIGAGAPVVTPLATGVKNGTLGARP